jgi:heme exporter protein A
MRQRVAAARAVLPDPELLLLDEPWSAVDPHAIALLEPLIGRASGRTRILVTHDVARGLAEADAFIGIRGGRIQAAGAASAASAREAQALFE